MQGERISDEKKIRKAKVREKINWVDRGVEVEREREQERENDREREYERADSG